MTNDIDKDMLNRLGGSGSNRQRGQSPANTWRDDYHIPGISDLRLRRLSQHELSSERNYKRIRTQADNHLKTNPLAALNIADRHTTQPIDTINGNGNGLTQQWTPIAMSQGYGAPAPASSVTSRTTYSGSKSTTRTQADQSRISIPSAPTLLPRKVEDPKGQYPTEPIRQKVTNDRPALSHHHEASSLSSSQNSQRWLTPKESVISGPSSEPQQNIVGPVDMTQSRPLRPMIICEQCGRSYKDPTGYSNHRRKKLSLPCPESSCGRIFCTKDYLERHVREEHNKKVHYCTSCLSQKQYVIYTNPLQLRSHIKLKHPNEI